LDRSYIIVNRQREERGMSTKILTMLLVLAAAVAAAPAGARSQDDDKKIVVRVMDLQFGDPTASCVAGVATYSLVSPAGAVVGSGTACLTSFASDCPLQVFIGCHETVLSTLTFNFVGRGSVTAPSTFNDVWISDTTVVIRVTGEITDGTGEFAGASGSMTGRGTIDYSAPQPDATWVVRLK
jgi:hypothetical protein